MDQTNYDDFKSVLDVTAQINDDFYDCKSELPSYF